MSKVPLMPTYYIGNPQSIKDIFDGKHLIHGEWHFYTELEQPAATDAVWVVMKDSDAAPHPAWVALPHLLDQTPVHAHLQGRPDPHVQSALKSTIITPTDSTFNAAQKLHKRMKVFSP